MIRKLTAAALGAATALVATSALAQDPAAAPAAPAPAAASASASADMSDTSGLSAAVLLGYGFGSVGGGGASFNPYGLGFGARVGYTLPMHLYIGGTFVYHLGASQDEGSGISLKENVYYFGGEVGYEIPAGPVLIRPYVGLGLAEASASISGAPAGFSGGSSSTSGVFFAPGATVLYPVASNIDVGVDGRFVIFSANGESANALSLFLTGQYHF